MAQRFFYFTKEEFQKTQHEDIEIKIAGLTGETFEKAYRYMNDYSGFQISTETNKNKQIIGYSVHTSDTPHNPPEYRNVPKEIASYLHNPPRDENFDEVLELNRTAYEKFYRQMFKNQ